MPIRIMVPLDGSEKDGRALAVASALASLAGAELWLVHVLERRAEDHAASEATRRAAEEERLAASAARVAADTGHQVTSDVLDGPDVVDSLVRHAAESDALAVVLGTRAPSAVGRVVVGSVADRVMRECRRPVVLVPPAAGYMAGKRVQFGRVLVPLDGSALADRALDFMLRLPHARELEYVLFEVVSSAGAGLPGDVSPALSAGSGRLLEVEARLEATATRLRAHGVTTVEVQVVDADNPATAITEAVRSCLVEMIAMSTRGTGGLRRLVLGSVAEGVVRASEVPVLLLTPATLAGA